VAIAIFVERYLRHLAIERGLAKNTQLAYRRDLEKYQEFLAERVVVDVLDIDPTTITEFRLWLSQRQALSAASTARQLAAIKGFHRFLLDENITQLDPAAKVKPPKQQRRLPKAISISEMERLLDASGPAPGSDDVTELIRYRDRAILEFLYATGARVSELVSLDVDDIIDGNIVRLFGKGSKERIVPVGSFAQLAVQNYLTRVRPTLTQGKGSPALFLNQLGGRLSRQSVWAVIQAAAERAELVQEVSPHTFRHSFATHLLEGGADVRVVQELLGHASVTTTQIYTLVTAHALKDAYLNAHPRAR
jgi:integrase/recombinase XerD